MIEYAKNKLTNMLDKQSKSISNQLPDIKEKPQYELKEVVDSNGKILGWNVFYLEKDRGFYPVRQIIKDSFDKIMILIPKNVLEVPNGNFEHE